MAAVLTALPTRPTATVLTDRGPIAVPTATAQTWVPEAAYLEAIAEREAAEDLAADFYQLLLVTARELELLKVRTASLAVLAGPEHGAL